MAETSDTVGVIGIGIMGSSIARNIAKSGLAVVGYDVDEKRLALLRESGGMPARSAARLTRPTCPDKTCG